MQDLLGNYEGRWCNIRRGGGASLVGSFGYMRVPTVENVAGNGVEISIGGGGPGVGGVTMVAAYDEKGYFVEDGILGYLGYGTDVHGGAT